MQRDRLLRIITNADDAGRSPEVNDAIFALMAEGLVTSSTLLANGPAVAEACRAARTTPHRSFGVHLNVTQFQPLTRGNGLAPLLDHDGCFDRPRFQRARASAPLLRAIYREWCAQVERLQRSGVTVGHIDSHHHVHNSPSLLAVLKAVQRKYGIRRVRISQNVFSSSEPRSRTFMAKKWLFNTTLRYLLLTRTTDAMTDLATFLEQRQRLSSAIRTLEIMLHPGAPESANETAQLREVARHTPEFVRGLVSYVDV